MNNKEKQDLIDSIHHWEMDVIIRLKNDDKIIKNYTNVWESDCSVPKIGGPFCALCRRYHTFYNRKCDVNVGNCQACVWVKHTQGRHCDVIGQEYNTFLSCFTLKSAQDVVNKLWSIGLQDHSRKHFVSDYEYYCYDGSNTKKLFSIDLPY